MPFSPCPRGSLLEQQLRRWSLGGSPLTGRTNCVKCYINGRSRFPCSTARRTAANNPNQVIQREPASPGEQPFRSRSETFFFAKRRVAVRSAAPPASPDPLIARRSSTYVTSHRDSTFSAVEGSVTPPAVDIIYTPYTPTTSTASSMASSKVDPISDEIEVTSLLFGDFNPDLC